MRLITSYGYRVQILFRLLRVTRRLVQQLEIDHDIRFRWAGERVPWLDVIQLERLPRYPAATPGTPPSVAGGDVTALDGVGGVAMTTMQPRAYMTGQREDRGHGFHVRLVMGSNDCFGRDVCTGQSLPKKCLRNGPIAFVPQQYIRDLPVLIAA